MAAGSPSHSAADGQVTEPPVVHPSVHSSRAARQEGTQSQIQAAERARS